MSLKKTISLFLVIVSFLVLNNHLCASESTSKKPIANDQTTSLFLNTNKVNPLKVGQLFKVVLEENASTGYSWSYIVNSKAINLISDQTITKNRTKAGEPIVGAPSIRVWTFKALKRGTYTLHFSYSRPWEKNIPPIKTVKYLIKVK